MQRAIAALALAFLVGGTAPGVAASRVPLVLKSAPPFDGALMPAGIYRLDRAHSRLIARVRRNGGAPVL